GVRPKAQGAKADDRSVLETRYFRCRDKTVRLLSVRPVSLPYFTHGNDRSKREILVAKNASENSVSDWRKNPHRLGDSSRFSLAGSWEWAARSPNSQIALFACPS